jgi:hypothetical protein
VQSAHALGLTQLSVVIMEAMKTAEKQLKIEKLERSNLALDKLVIQERAKVESGRLLIKQLETQLGRRGSRKARTQHPEKRR